MGLLDFFKKKPAGQCSSCKSNIANYRCPSCGTEHCESCVKAWADKMKSAGPGPKISITSGGVVDTATSRSISGSVNARMKAIREMAEKGKGICLGCTIEQGKTIALKAI